jgi:hypothetical protein
VLAHAKQSIAVLYRTILCDGACCSAVQQHCTVLLQVYDGDSDRSPMLTAVTGTTAQPITSSGHNFFLTLLIQFDVNLIQFDVIVFRPLQALFSSFSHLMAQWRTLALLQATHHSLVAGLSALPAQHCTMFQCIFPTQ